jgi:hypothetical protein
MEEVRRLGGAEFSGESDLPRGSRVAAFWRALTQVSFRHPR